MMQISKQLKNDADVTNLKNVASAYYKAGEKHPGAAFALFAMLDSHELTTRKGIKNFEEQISLLELLEEGKAYYAGKFFRSLVQSTTGTALQKVYRDLGRKYLSQARGAASYKGAKADAYVDADILAEAKNIYNDKLQPSRFNYRNIQEKTLRKARQMIVEKNKTSFWHNIGW